MRGGEGLSKKRRSMSAPARCGLMLGVAAALACADGAVADIAFVPVVTQHAAAHDRDGVWPDRDLLPEGNPPVRPNIYTAKHETEDGSFFLSQITSRCKRYLCPFQLRFIDRSGRSRLLASGYSDWGGIVTLSSDRRSVTFRTFKTEQTVMIADPFERDPGKGGCNPVDAVMAHHCRIGGVTDER